MKFENDLYLIKLKEAIKFHVANELPKAKRLYKDIIKTRPHSPQVLSNLAAILDIEGRDIEALELLMNAHHLAPNDEIISSNLQEMKEKISGPKKETVGHVVEFINDDIEQKVPSLIGLEGCGFSVEDVVIDLTLCGRRNGPNVHGGGIYGYRLAEAIIEKVVGCKVHLLVDGEFTRQSQDGVEIYRNWVDSPSIPEVLDRPSTLVIYPLPYKYFRYQRFGLKYARCMPAILGMRNWEQLRQNEYRLEILTGGSSSQFERPIEDDLSGFESCLADLKSGDGVICLTQFVAESLRLRFPDLSFETYILPPLIDSNAPMSVPFSRTGDYRYRFLFLGPERQEKNYKLLQQASKFFREKDGFEIHLLTDNPARFPDLPNSELVIHETPISEVEKGTLIDYVDCLIYPSLSEGFGMPPMEFCRHGRESIVSAIQPHLSLYSDVSHFVNPSDPFDLYRQMKVVAEMNPSLDRSQNLRMFFERYCSETDQRYNDFITRLNVRQMGSECQSL